MLAGRCAGHLISITVAVMISLLVVYFHSNTFRPNIDQELKLAVSKIMAAEELAAIYGPSKKRYECINAHLGRIRHEKTLVELLRAWHSCRDSFVGTFGPFQKLSEGLQFGAFLTLVSSRVAPYGSSDGMPFNQAPSVILKHVLGAKSLTCSGQSAFVAKTLKLAFPKLEIRQIGVINNSINHAMVYACDSSGAVLLDPTTSIVVVSPLQDILKGKPVGISQMIDYYDGNDELLEQFRRKLRGALRNGGIRESDLVYNKLL